MVSRNDVIYIDKLDHEIRSIESDLSELRRGAKAEEQLASRLTRLTEELQSAMAQLRNRPPGPGSGGS